MSNIQEQESTNQNFSSYKDKIISALNTIVDLENNNGKHKSPGIEILISQKGNILLHEAMGIQSMESPEIPLTKGLVYDLGTLTQIISTTTIFMKLVEQNLLDLNSRVSRILQSFGAAGKETMKVHHLLSHTSGFKTSIPAHRMIIKGQASLNSLMTRRAALHILYNEIYRTRLSNIPGKVHQYSDIGFLLLGNIAEVVSGTPLNKLFTEIVTKPFKLSGTGYIDLEQIRRKTFSLEKEMLVPTYFCPWRKKRIHGEPSDELAWSIGGISSHSGLFGNAMDLNQFASSIIDSYHMRPSPIDSAITKHFFNFSGDKNSENQTPYSLGWQSIPLNAEFTLYGSWSHTGTALWIEPKSETVIILLSNSTQISPRNTQTVENLFKSSIRPLFEETSFTNG